MRRPGSQAQHAGQPVSPAELCTVNQVRQIEQAGLSQGLPLMERAGLAAADLAVELLGRVRQGGGRRVLVIAGPGNNGGDALECATHLKRRFFGVTTVFIGEETRLPADARLALQKWREAGGRLEAELPDPLTARGHWDLVIDGLFGIGLSRPLTGATAQVVERINQCGLPVLSLDVPSGLNADTGAIMGVAVRASHTLTFITGKPGLHTLDGPDCCGEVHCASLGTEALARPAQPGRLLDHSVLGRLPRRPANFHKGMAGDVGIIGGATGMLGAPLISGRAALCSGAGRVFVGFISSDGPAADPLQPELMMRPPRQLIDACEVLALGPGMGDGADARALLAAALAGSRALVLDADALNLLGADASLAGAAAQRTAATLLTPHPAEAGRLLGTTTAEVQRDRLAATCELARRFHACVVLKGKGSILAAPDGRWSINATGNPGMASAGMGDALTGMLASLLAQGLPAMDALELAVWLHGRAGDELAAGGDGPIGITATDVVHAARRVLNATP
jgi:hydroxyethylthiazole kinase-like uncharacterized protein yjeF